MEREGFIFYRSFAESLKEVDAETKAAVLDMLCSYALDGIELDASGIPAALFKLMKPQIDANNRKRENGKKGGRPKTEEEPKENQNETKTNQSITKAEPSDVFSEPKEKDKEKDKDKEKVKDIKHKHGEYNHVLLTDNEHSSLLQEFGAGVVAEAVRLVDEYCETSGKRYKNYNLVIRKWGIQQAQKGRSSPARSPGRMYDKQIYDFDEIERTMVNV